MANSQFIDVKSTVHGLYVLKYIFNVNHVGKDEGGRE